MEGYIKHHAPFPPLRSFNVTEKILSYTVTTADLNQFLTRLDRNASIYHTQHKSELSKLLASPLSVTTTIEFGQKFSPWTK